ncbi:hypothetical protein GCM10027062_29020 [Nocardioides hungaricus]
MGADDAFGDPAYDGGVALRVDRLPAHQLAHMLVELLDQAIVLRQRHASPEMDPASSVFRLDDGFKPPGLTAVHNEAAHRTSSGWREPLNQAAGSRAP